jgi:hypothetical protein
MSRKSTLFLLIGLAATTFACRNNEPEKEKSDIYGDFFVRYLAPEQELKAYASFSQGDSVQNSIPISMESGVTFQGSGMEARDLQGQQIRYIYQTQTNYTAPYTFKTQTPDGRALEHTIAMKGIGKFSIQEGVISKSKGMTLVVEQGSLEKGESIVMLFTVPATGASYTVITTGPHPNGIHAIPPTTIPALPKGKVQLYLVKKQEAISDTSVANITASAEYYSDMIEVEVVE